MSETEAVLEEFKKEKREPKLLEKHFSIDGSYAYQRSAITLPVGWKFEWCLKPEFWAQVAYKFKGDKMTGGIDVEGGVVEVRTEDHAFYGELYVRAVRDDGIVAAVLREPVYFGLQEIKSSAFETKWNVGKRKFDIIRLSDREVVASAKTKDDAQSWINATTGVRRAA